MFVAIKRSSSCELVYLEKHYCVNYILYQLITHVDPFPRVSPTNVSRPHEFLLRILA